MTTLISRQRATHRQWLGVFLAAGLIAAAIVPAPAQGQSNPIERARQAEARGELRAAQLELRNAVRADPNSALARARLGAVSLELGELEIAERELRAALDRGYDRADGTRMLMRLYLGQRRNEELLRDFPLDERTMPAALAGQIAAAHALALLQLQRIEDAERLAADARRLAPRAVEPALAAGSVALARRDLAAAEAETDRALALDPNHPEALLRKSALQAQRGDAPAAVATLDRLLGVAPGHQPGRLARAEMLMRAGDAQRARQDVEFALRVMPNSVAAVYMRALLSVSGQDWRAADEDLQRIAPVLSNFPDGFLVLALAKRGLGQIAQAEDAAQRHVARRPEDPRGAKLLAAIQMQEGRPADAAATLSLLAARGAADAESFELLGRAYLALRRSADAAEAIGRAAALVPGNAAMQVQLAAVRLRAGNAAGSVEAARVSLSLAPGQPGARELLATALFALGRVAEATAEYEQLDAASRRGELAATLDGNLRLLRLDFDGAQSVFRAVLRDHPTAIGARLGLARIAALEGRMDEMQTLLAEVLRNDPANADAIRSLSALAQTAGAAATAARATLEAAQTAAPQEPALALAMAGILIRSGAPARAAELLGAEALAARGRGVTLPLARAEAHIAAGQWAEAEAASRIALAEDPQSAAARRQLALLLLRGGDGRAAEALVQEGLRARPADALLQQTMIGLVMQARGIDAALALADALAADPSAHPTALFLRGDLLLQAGRAEEAAAAYASAALSRPMAALAVRQAQAWRRAGRAAESDAALDAWLAQAPDDDAVLGIRAQFDIDAGRMADAERRLTALLARAPGDAVALNNLAWVLSSRDDAGSMARARELAERAFFLRPGAEAADTLGWIMARAGDPRRALPLLRLAAEGSRGSASAPVIAYHLAFVLNALSEHEEARRVLTPVLESNVQFADRAAAERLLASLPVRR